MNPPNANFCGDCGCPISIVRRQWTSYLGLYQKIIKHPHRNRVFGFAVAGGLAVPVFLMFAVHQGLVWTWAWEEIGWLLLALGTGTSVVYLMYPAGSRIVAFLMGAFFFVMGYLLSLAIIMRVNDIIARP
jgi:hypothetical protein